MTTRIGIDDTTHEARCTAIAACRGAPTTITPGAVQQMADAITQHLHETYVFQTPWHRLSRGERALLDALREYHGDPMFDEHQRRVIQEAI